MRLARLFAEPPIPQLVANSLLLGAVVGALVLVVGWFARANPRGLGPHALLRRGERPHWFLPPLVQGVGVLSLPWLAGLASRFVYDSGGWRPLYLCLANFADAINPDRSPWFLMVCCVSLAIAPGLLWSWQGAGKLDNSHPRRGARPTSNSAFDAAIVCGASRGRARALVGRRRLSRWLARYFVAGAFAATNLTPALFFVSWSEGQTIAPGVLDLAGLPGDARPQAALLALLAMAVNIAALAVARVDWALPQALERA
jgi:hypothetical protein